MSMLRKKLAREMRFAKYRFAAIALVVAIGILMFATLLLLSFGSRLATSKR